MMVRRGEEGTCVVSLQPGVIVSPGPSQAVDNCCVWRVEGGGGGDQWYEVGRPVVSYVLGWPTLGGGQTGRQHHTTPLQGITGASSQSVHSQTVNQPQLHQHLSVINTSHLA